MFDVNVFGLLSLSRTVLPHFLAKKNGHIVVTSSVCGKVGAPFSATYNATKHALHVIQHYIFDAAIVKVFSSTVLFIGLL